MEKWCFIPLKVSPHIPEKKFYQMITSLFHSTFSAKSLFLLSIQLQEDPLDLDTVRVKWWRGLQAILCLNSKNPATRGRCPCEPPMTPSCGPTVTRKSDFGGRGKNAQNDLKPPSLSLQGNGPFLSPRKDHPPPWPPVTRTPKTCISAFSHL